MRASRAYDGVFLPDGGAGGGHLVGDKRYRSPSCDPKGKLA